MANIAFLGAGMMGQPIIQNFLRGGHAVKVYNRTLAKAKPLEALGAVLAATPREAASGVDAIFSSVINDDASRAVWTGTDGALQAELQPGAYAIEMSTVSLTWVSELKDLATGRGLHFMDCPVAGRPDVAEAGQLKVFAGGSADAGRYQQERDACGRRRQRHYLQTHIQRHGSNPGRSLCGRNAGL
jgi:3-hydroxyisobutyrate dehydrogenase-like beta-hydroxyacid dehydrogenase